MSFKDMIAEDLERTFFNLEEFADTHVVDGKEVSLIIDNDELKRRQGGQEYAIEESSTLFYCKSEDVARKKPGQSMKVDGRICTVDDWKEDMGMATVVLRENIVA